MANPSARHARRRVANERQAPQTRLPQDSTPVDDYDDGASTHGRSKRQQQPMADAPAAHAGKHVASHRRDDRAQLPAAASAHDRSAHQHSHLDQRETRRDSALEDDGSKRRGASALAGAGSRSRRKLAAAESDDARGTRNGYLSRASKRTTAKAAAMLADGRLELTEDEEAKSSTRYLKTLLVVLVSMLYWPIAIMGVTAPFTAGFNFGTLSMGQVVFARFWLAFVLLGAFYAVIVNLGHIRDAAIFAPNKVLRIAIFLAADVAISFVLIRLVCLF